MQRNTKWGFTLIELLIVVGIIAIITSVALPKLLEARMRAQEQLAMQTLEVIANAEYRFKQLNVIDTDGDEVGEYGYLNDLLGATTYRTRDMAYTCKEVEDLNLVIDSMRGDYGRMKIENKSGYCFQIFLLRDENGKLKGIPCYETAGNRPEKQPDSEFAELFWCAYAWPLKKGSTGEKAFYVSSLGKMLQTSGVSSFEGQVVPPFDCAVIPIDTDFSRVLENPSWIPVVESN